MASKKTKIKLIKTDIDFKTVESFLNKISTRKVLEEAAEDVIQRIGHLYEDGQGNPVEWKIKVYPSSRKNRMYVAVTTDAQDVRYKEAKNGLIRKELNRMKITGAPKLSWVKGKGFILQ